MFKRFIFSIVIIFALFSCEENNLPLSDYPERVDIESQQMKIIWKAPRVLPFDTDKRNRVTMNSLIKDDYFITFKDHFVESYNKNTGELIWRTQVIDLGFIKNFTYQENFIEHGNQIIFISDEKIYSLDYKTGAIVWEINIDIEFNIALNHNNTCQSERLLFISDRASNHHRRHKIIAIDKNSGAIVWETTEPLIQIEGVEYPSGMIEAPLYAPEVDRLYIGAKRNALGGSFICVDAKNGDRIFEKVFDGFYDPNCPDFDARGGYFSNNLPKLANDGILLTTGPYVTKFDFDGNIIWSVLEGMDCLNGESNRNSILIDGFYYNHTLEFVGNQRTFMVKIDENNGNMVWSKSMNEVNNKVHTVGANHPYYNDGVIYRVFDDGYLYGVDVNSSENVLVTHIQNMEYKDADSTIYSGFSGGLAVEDGRFYYIGKDYIFCVEPDFSDEKQNSAK